MKKLIQLTAGCFLFIQAQAQLTPFEEWASTTGSQNFFVKSKTKTDDVGSVYVAGATLNGSGNYDILVTKFNSSGNHLYTYQLDGYLGSHDAATSLWVDGSHNVYITGFIIDSASQSADIFVTKLNSSFSAQWSKRYNGTGSSHDMGTDIRVDNSGNVYITGGRTNTTPNSDVITIKYNSSGTQQWATVFNNNTANLNDLGARIIGFTSTAIKISLVSQTSSTQYSYGLKAYSLSTGTQTATSVLGSSSSSIEEATAIAQDSDKNTYIVGAIDTGGSAGLNYCMIKIDSAAAIVWEQYYNSPDDLDDVATGVAVDDDGYIYVTGYTTTTSEATNYTTLKLDPSGNILWNKDYHGGGADTASAIVIHNDTTLVVTGTSFNGGNFEYYTIKYDTNGVNTIWAIPYNNSNRLHCSAHSLAIDTTNSVIVTGQGMLPDTTFEYVTVKYDEIIAPPDFDEESFDISFSYQKNLGQLWTTDSTEATMIDYYNPLSYPKTYLDNDTASFVFARIDTLGTDIDSMQRIDMSFYESNANAEMYSMQVSKEYYNYFIGDTEVPNVPGYKRIVVRNIYPKIDLHYFSNDQGIKYYFVVKPTGDPDDIQMVFDGADSIDITGNNELLLYTQFDTLNFISPIIYQYNSALTISNVTGSAGWQHVSGNQYEIGVGSYNTSLPLVIEISRDAEDGPQDIQTLNWSTYFGGDQSEEILDTEVDALGNILIAGYTGSAFNFFPITTGAYSGTLGGSGDAFLGKFDPQGIQLFCTYFGGSDYERANTVAFKTPVGDIYIAGYTTSTNMPVIGSSPKFIQNSMGSTPPTPDAFIFRVNSTGNFGYWSTYYGGNGWDEIYSMKVDPSSGQMVAVGFTESTTFPTEATGGQYTQTCIAGGLGNDIDGFLLKFDANDDRDWATCYGGSSGFIPTSDYVTDIDFDVSGRILATGTTVSPGFPVYVAGGDYSHAYNSGSDAFILRFSSTGTRQWAICHGGTLNESGRAIHVDQSTNEIYLTGRTYSTDMTTQAYSVGGAYYQSSKSSCSDAYLVKFDNNYQLVWSTYFGGSGCEFGRDVVTDAYGDVYFVGSTGGTTPVPSPNASNTYTQSYAGSDDAYIASFNPGLKHVWGTYLGGTNLERIWSVAADPNQEFLYITGASSSNADYPLDNGAGIPYYDGSYNGPTYDGVLTRFDMVPVVIASVPDDEDNKENPLTFYVFPNPATDMLYLQLKSNATEDLKISIFNSIGQIVGFTTLKNSERSMQINIAELATGVYHLRVEGNSMNAASVKFVKE